MAKLAVGRKAPEFELPGDGGGVIKLADLLGRPVVLFFYPQDDTETCTKEAVAFSQLKGEFDKLGARLVGLSPDSQRKHDKFKAKYDLRMALASDPERRAIEAYGVWGEKTTFGRTYMGVERTTFLIDAAGKINRIWRVERVAGHAEDVLEAVRALAA